MVRLVSGLMTRPWDQILAHYAECKADSRSVRSLEALVRRICESELRKGLFAWTSMLDLCIAQTEVSYPYNGPYLRLSPVTKDQIEFRYVDTLNEQRQWRQTVDAEEAWSRLVMFLDRLRWFRADVLMSIRPAHTHGQSTVKTMEDASGTKRVEIFQRTEGTFGFAEYHWLEEDTPTGIYPYWSPLRPDSLAIFDTAERAEQEARSRVEWLRSTLPSGDVSGRDAKE